MEGGRKNKERNGRAWPDFKGQVSPQALTSTKNAFLVHQGDGEKKNILFRVETKNGTGNKNRKAWSKKNPPFQEGKRQQIGNRKYHVMSRGLKGLRERSARQKNSTKNHYGVPWQTVSNTKIRGSHQA